MVILLSSSRCYVGERIQSQAMLVIYRVVIGGWQVWRKSAEKGKNFSSRKQTELIQLTLNKTPAMYQAVFTGKGTKESRNEMFKNMEIIPWNGDIL